MRRLMLEDIRRENLVRMVERAFPEMNEIPVHIDKAASGRKD
jgi:hypothetical protein